MHNKQEFSKEFLNDETMSITAQFLWNSFEATLAG